MGVLEAAIFVALVVVGSLYLYSRRWQRYDPAWLIDLAAEQCPDDKELMLGLERCTKIRGNYFVEASRPNQPGAKWQFARSVTLCHPEYGEVVLDVLKDGRVGSIEYLGQHLARKSSQ